MFGIFKAASPTDYVVKYNRKGKKIDMGVGIAPMKGIWNKFALIPTGVREVPFTFREVTSDLLSVVIVGNFEITVKVDGDETNPPVVLELYNFEVDSKTGRFSTQPSPLDIIDGRVTNSIRKYVREVIAGKTLQECIKGVNSIQSATQDILIGGPQKEVENDWGVRLGSFSINTIEPSNTDLKEALEAPVREQLLGESDEAIAKRQEDASKNARQLAVYQTETKKVVAKEESEVVKQQGKNDLLRIKAEGEGQVALAKAKAESEVLLAEAEAEAAELLVASYAEVPAMKLLAMAVYDGKFDFAPDKLIITPDMITNLVESLGQGKE